MALLDCRDTRISLWHDQGAVHSPGFVALEGGEYRFGEDARAQSRLRPQHTSSRFWWQLSTQPLKPPMGAARHTADLVHSHLRHVHEQAGGPPGLTLAVPDSMPREQLSLLLGVAQACDFEVRGLVSRSVLLATGSDLFDHHQRLVHLEAQLNQTILNELALDGDRVHLVRSTPLPSCGLLALQERCVSAIASAFIQQTRFDPRRSAATEQTLYNMLPGVLEALRERGEASIDINGHRCRVTVSTVAAAGDRLLSGLSSARENTLPVLLDPELRLLPGLDGIAGPLSAVEESSLWQTWQHQQGHVENPGEDIHLVDRLPVLSESASADEKPAVTGAPGANREPSPATATTASIATAAADSATHVLVGTRAMPLRGDQVLLGGGFVLRAQGSQWTLHGDGALINGLPSTPVQPVVLGDTLSLGSAGHGRLIEVLD